VARYQKSKSARKSGQGFLDFSWVFSRPQCEGGAGGRFVRATAGKRQRPTQRPADSAQQTEIARQRLTAFGTCVKHHDAAASVPASPSAASSSGLPLAETGFRTSSGPSWPALTAAPSETAGGLAPRLDRKSRRAACPAYPRWHRMKMRRALESGHQRPRQFQAT
jgi:hypothetical protein